MASAPSRNPHDEPDYLFGFNNPNYSDRVLVLVSEYSNDNDPSEAGQAGEQQHEGGSPTSNDTDDNMDDEGDGEMGHLGGGAAASAGGSDSSPEREHVGMLSSSSSSSHTQRHPRHAHMTHPHSHSSSSSSSSAMTSPRGGSARSHSHEPVEGSPPRIMSRSPSATAAATAADHGPSHEGDDEGDEDDDDEEAAAGGGSTPMSDDNSPPGASSSSSSATTASSSSSSSSAAVPRVTTRRASSARSHSSGSGIGGPSASSSSSSSSSSASNATSSNNPPNVQVNLGASSSSSSSSSTANAGGDGSGAPAASSSNNNNDDAEAATGGGSTPTATVAAVGLTTPPHASASSHHRYQHHGGSGGARRSVKRNLPTPSRAVTRNMARKTDRKQSVRTAQKRETHHHSRGSSSRHRNSNDHDVKHMSTSRRSSSGGGGSGRRPAPPTSALSSAFSLDMEDEQEGDSLWVSSLILSGFSPFFKRLFNGPEHLPHHARSGSSSARSVSRYGQGGDSYAYGESGSQSMMPRSTSNTRASLSTFKDNDTYSVEIIVPPSQRSMFKLVIKFMYSERNSDEIVHAGMSAKDILDFLFMADKYQVSAAVSKALVVLSRIPLTLNLCETLLKLPPNLRNSNLTNPSYAELHKKMQDYLVSEFKQFDNVYTSTKFKELSVEALVLVLSSSKLCLRSENTVWRAVHIWLNHKPDTREFTPKLFDCIRFPMMHLDFLLDVVTKSSDCFDVVGLDTRVNEAVSFLATRSKPRQEQMRKSDKTDRFTPRTQSNEAYVYHGKFRREDIQNLEVGKPIYSDKFLVDGYEFLIKLRKVPQQGTFGVYLGAYHEIPDSRNTAKHLEVTARFSFAAKVANTGQDSDFRPLHRQVTHKFLPRPGHNTSWGYNDILGMQWDDIFTGSSEYFHDNLFHLRVEISVLEPQRESSAAEGAAPAAAAAAV